MNSVDDILSKAEGLRQTVVVAASEEPHLLASLKEAKSRGIVEPILVGNEDQIRKVARHVSFDLNDVQVCACAHDHESVHVGLDIVRSGRASILMKGLVNSRDFLGAVLDKRYGIRRSRLLSHVALFFPGFYPKPVLLTDAGLNTMPSFDEKLVILEQGVGLLHSLGIEKPKVAILAHNEIPSEKIPGSWDAVRLVEAVSRGGLTDCVVEGPLSLDLALDAKACRTKRIETRVGGQADMLLCPDILSGNILYKSMTVIGSAPGAALIVGASVPIILTSRGDSVQTKLLSLALAALTC